MYRGKDVLFQPMGYMYEVDTYDVIDDTCFRVPIGNLVVLLDAYSTFIIKSP